MNYRAHKKSDKTMSEDYHDHPNSDMLFFVV